MHLLIVGQLLELPKEAAEPLLALGRARAANGDGVTVLTSFAAGGGRGSKKAALLSLGGQVVVAKSQPAPLSGGAIGRFVNEVRFAHWVRKQRVQLPKPNVVIVAAAYPALVQAALLLVNGLGVPAILELRVSGSVAGGIMRRLARPLENYLWKRAAAVVTPDEALEKELRTQTGLDKDRLRRLPPAGEEEKRLALYGELIGKVTGQSKGAWARGSSGSRKVNKQNGANQAAGAAVTQVGGGWARAGR